MHDSIMAQIGMDEHHSSGGDNYGQTDGWVDISHSYNSSQHQSPIYEAGGYSFLQPAQQNHGMPIEPSFNNPQRMPQQQQPLPSHPPPPHQQLLPLIMPSHPTWPSMLTNPATTTYSPAPVPIPAISAPVVKGNANTKPSGHGAPTARKTLSDNDRRLMCQYSEEHPSAKQTEIGNLFGVERSTVSKVLRQKEKYLFPEDRSLSPVKRAKGKFPDIERALSNWVRNNQKKGIPLTDSAIKEKARFFATTVGNDESHLKTNSTSWLEKFKQKNGIGSGKLSRRTSEANISDSGSLNPESTAVSTSQTPNGISPTSPSNLASPSPLSATKSSDEDMKTEPISNYMDFSHGTASYHHSNSQSTTSLSSAFSDPQASFSGATSPTTPFAFSPDNNSSSWLPSQQARLPPPGNSFQRPRSQTFPTLGIDPNFASQVSEPSTPRYAPVTAPSSALDSPIHEVPPSFGINSAVSSPPLHHSSSNGSMAPPSSTPLTGMQSPMGSSAPNSPTQDDARRALDTLLNFFHQAPNGLIDETDFHNVVRLTEKLRLHSQPPSLPGGLHRIEESEPLAPKMEQTMSAGC